MATIDTIRDENGTLPAYAFPGGYPIFYTDSDNSILCPDCANSSDSDPDEIDSFKPTDAGIHWEGSPLCCEQCNKEIESAYGELEE